MVIGGVVLIREVSTVVAAAAAAAATAAAWNVSAIEGPLKKNQLLKRQVSVNETLLSFELNQNMM